MAYSYFIHINKHRIWDWPRLNSTSVACLHPPHAESRVLRSLRSLPKAMSTQVPIKSKDKDSTAS